MRERERERGEGDETAPRMFNFTVLLLDISGRDNSFCLLIRLAISPSHKNNDTGPTGPKGHHPINTRQ